MMAERKMKTLAPVRILQILQRYSDIKHPLTQKEIAAYLKDEYGITMERKAIGAHIKDLADAGFEVVAKRGCYMEGRTFLDSELRLLIDGVLQSKHITASHSTDLIERLCSLSSVHFRSHIKNVYSVNEWCKTENYALFCNIEIVDEAIAAGKKIKFRYNKYGIDGKLHPRSLHTVSPYQLILHNQHYYLLGRCDWAESIFPYRMEKISNMTMLDEYAVSIRKVKGYESGIDYKRISSSMPYMYTDTPERIEFIADIEIADQVVDWFGQDVRMTPLVEDNKRMRVSLLVSPKAMKYWAMQYADHVVVTAPESLRAEIRKSLENALKGY